MRRHLLAGPSAGRRCRGRPARRRSPRRRTGEAGALCNPDRRPVRFPGCPAGDRAVRDPALALEPTAPTTPPFVNPSDRSAVQDTAPVPRGAIPADLDVRSGLRRADGRIHRPVTRQPGIGVGSRPKMRIAGRSGPPAELGRVRMLASVARGVDHRVQPARVHRVTACRLTAGTPGSSAVGVGYRYSMG